MSIVTGGHPPAVYVPKEGPASFIELEGDILGMFEGVYLGEREIEVNQGDRFFLYTDGLIEEIGEQTVWTGGLTELLTVCEQLRDIPIRNAAENLLNRMPLDLDHLKDDVVVLGIEV